MNIVNVSKSTEDSEKFIGTFADETHYDKLITKPTRAYDQDGKELFSFVPNAIPNNIAKSSYLPLTRGATHTNNRGSATEKGAIKYSVKKDGTMSKTNKIPYGQEVLSGIAGYFDRYTRHPF